jgi:hypothetical protein
MDEKPKSYKLRCTEAKAGKGAKNYAKNDEYYTPKQIVKMFSEGFEYDPATTKEKAEDLGILNYDTIETDGLKSDWTQYKSIWCNPPFTIKQEFLKKAQDYYDRTGGGVYMLVPIEFLTTKRFHSICKGAKIYLPNGRVKFESGVGRPTRSPAFGSVIIKLDKGWSLEPIDISGVN